MILLTFQSGTLKPYRDIILAVFKVHLNQFLNKFVKMPVGIQIHDFRIP